MTPAELSLARRMTHLQLNGMDVPPGITRIRANNIYAYGMTVRQAARWSNRVQPYGTLIWVPWCIVTGDPKDEVLQVFHPTVFSVLPVHPVAGRAIEEDEEAL